MLEWVSSEWKNINREWVSLFITITLTHWGAWEGEEKLSQWERERQKIWRSSLCFRVLLLPLVLILSLSKLWGFLVYGFPEENSLCLLSLASIVVHVILWYKILRSYYLNYKNLTLNPNQKWVEIHHNSKTEVEMEKPLVTLGFWHLSTARDTPIDGFMNQKLSILTVF